MRARPAAKVFLGFILGGAAILSIAPAHGRGEGRLQEAFFALAKQFKLLNSDGTVTGVPSTRTVGTGTGITGGGDLSSNRTLALDATASPSFASMTLTGSLTVAGSKPVLTLDKVATTTAVVNTATETAIYSSSIAGGTLGTTNSLRLSIRGKISSASLTPGTFTVRAYYGSESFLVVNGVTLLASASSNPAKIDVDLSAGNATGAQFISASYGDNTGLLGALLNFQVRGTPARDSTTAQTLKVTVQFGTASNSNSFTTEFARLELIQ